MLLSIALILACVDEPPPAPPDARPLTSTVPTGDPRVAMAQAMGLSLEHPQVEDLWTDRAYRVDLFDEDGDKRPDRGLLDVDRDGNAEQRWSRGDDGALMVETSFEAEEGLLRVRGRNTEANEAMQIGAAPECQARLSFFSWLLCLHLPEVSVHDV